MSEDKKPPLSPQEQQQNEDAAKIETQFGATDVMERFATAMDRIGFGNPGGIFSRTSFEERGLNDMLDLLDGAKPSDLVKAGENLEKAKTSLNKAAQELSDFVKATDWHGAAATEFQRYGSELARYAWDLGSFANVVGTQMTVAGGGLTSVRSAKPPRDNRADPRRPKDFPVSEQRDDNPEYKRAVQVEENRQEAINQMNRLASFYAVSEQSLAGAKEPELPKMLATAVPRPQGGEQFATRDTTVPGGDRLGEADGQSALRPGSVSSPEGAPRAGAHDLVTETPTPSTSMEIDSVTTLPPTPSSPGPAQPLPVNGGPPAGDGYVPPLGPNSGPTRPGGSPRQGPSAVPRGGGPGPGANARTGTGGGGRPGPVGRPPVMGGGGNSSGTGANRSPVGRPTGVGPGVGRTGGAGGTRSPMVGRPSSGGPMTGRSGSGTSAGPRAGRGNGIVGGTPQQRASGTGTSGSRIPRGNVIGGQGGAPDRSSSAARPTGRGIPGSNGVVGTPRSGGTPPRPGVGGFTTGGSGLSGEQRGRQPDGEERESPEQPRTDNRMDDPGTRTARRQGAVPPVIE
ncbi:hypothetical protein GCM10011583_00180 [Streptomyces camponoticapitis]|uniref:Translation initiation factor IF-2 n=1 Tax=Streptomyces camponoticapitis TaxID=1616125 RepID=A0ABQ2DTF7_9ACTN|nr:hypothetical protein [Streptomyces camponoticapitis]GGJ72773.1 hypothetical protein GCM10011583_00180 [Streptomyces camponoticapitis]